MGDVDPLLDRSPCGHRPDDSQCIAVPLAPSSVLVLALQLGAALQAVAVKGREAWMLAGHGCAWMAWMGWGKEGALRTVCHGCC